VQGFLRLLLWVGLILGLIALIGWAFLFESHEVPDNSMAPNLIKGDRVLVYILASFDTGSTAVCKHPSDSSKVVFGRIVGTPGDRVKIDRSSLYINNNQTETTVEEDYVLVDEQASGPPQTVKMQRMIETTGMIRYSILMPAASSRASRRRAMREKRVDDGRYFLMADNRAYGEDSRVYGQVEISSCIGSPLLVYQPGEGAGDAASSDRWFSIVR